MSYVLELQADADIHDSPMYSWVSIVLCGSTISIGCN